MELPTYTSIWRIEKRLYKLYDFRLPMPLPVGQIAVFTAVTVPYVVLLTLFGLPFNHSLFWLYVLPPGLLTWLATRPVLESKRLPELLISQARYLGEPSTWCRMAPLAEKDQVLVFGRVWRRASVAATAEVAQAEIASAEQAVGELPATARPALPVATPVARPVPAQAAAADPVPARQSRGRQARGRLVRQRQAPERLAPEGAAAAQERAPAAPPRDERVGQAAELWQSRWARAAGPSRLPSATAEPGAPDSVRPPGLAGEAQRTPVDGVGWGKDAAARTWRDPGLAGPAGKGRHAAPARPPAPVGYAAGGGARPGTPGTNGPATNGPVAGGQVIGGAGQRSRDSRSGGDAGTGWPMVGYGTAASARPVDPAASARPDDRVKDSGSGQSYGLGRNAGPSADEGAGRPAGTGWPAGYRADASVRPGALAGPTGKTPGPVPGKSAPAPWPRRSEPTAARPEASASAGLGTSPAWPGTPAAAGPEMSVPAGLGMPAAAGPPTRGGWTGNFGSCERRKACSGWTRDAGG